MISQTYLIGLRNDVLRAVPGADEDAAVVFLAALVACASPYSSALWTTCAAVVGVDPRLREYAHPAQIFGQRPARREGLSGRIETFVNCAVEQSQCLRDIRFTGEQRDALFAAATVVARCERGNADETLISVAVTALYYQACDVAKCLAFVNGRAQTRRIADVDQRNATAWLFRRLPDASRALLAALDDHRGEVTVPRAADSYGFTPEGVRSAATTLERAGVIEAAVKRRSRSTVTVIRWSPSAAELAAKFEVPRPNTYRQQEVWQ